MQLTYRNERFIAISTYAEKDIPKTAGFRWDSDSRCWWTKFQDTAAKLAQYADNLSRNPRREKG